MVGNILKSASPPMMAQLAGFGSIVRSLSAPVATAVNSLDSMDWRHVFVASDALFLFEASESCVAPLDDANVGEKSLALLRTASDPASPVGATLRKRSHLMQRVAAIGLLWLGRQKVVSEEVTSMVATAASAIIAMGTVDLAAERANGNGHGVAHMLEALVAFGAGDRSKHDSCKAVLVTRVRDWAAIEATALAQVRSPEFAAAAAAAGDSVENRVGVTADSGSAPAGAVPTAREGKAAGRAQQAAQAKAEGNRHFKEANYPAALEAYSKAAELLDEQQVEGGDIAAAADVEQAKVWSNSAECHLRLEQ
jgi:hypothetical protein